MKIKRTIPWSITGIIFIIIGIPFILETIPPNRWSGFRVGKTLSDERIWYAANRVMGYDLVIAGTVIFLTALVTARYFRGNRRVGNRINLLILLGSLAAVFAHSYWALNRM